MLNLMLNYIRSFINKSHHKKLLLNGNLKVGENSDIDGLKMEVKLVSKGALNIEIGSDCLIFGSFFVEKPTAKITVGNGTFLGGSSFIAADEIIIGDHVMFSWGCTTIDTNAHSLNNVQRQHDVMEWKKSIAMGKPGALKNWDDVESKKIIIKNNAWIGFNSILLKGITIGEGAVVAAGSVVTKDVDDFTLVGGNPAKFIKKL